MQFDVYHNPDRAVRETEPYIVEPQHDHLSHLRSVVTIPLLERTAATQITRLTPTKKPDQVVPLMGSTSEFDGRKLVLKVYDPVAYHRHVLKNPIGSIGHSRDAIVAAVDVLITGV